MDWEIIGGGILKPAPFCILGVVNVTPDSFSDGGRYASCSAAVGRITEMVRHAKGLPLAVDIGGESTRPRSESVTVEEELRRVLPVIEAAAELPDQERPAALSIDTSKSTVAAKALQSGAEIVNDISACAFDPELLDVLVEYKPGYVLMHCQGQPKNMQEEPHYENVVDEVFSFLESRMAWLVKAGLPERKIVLDPGIGFGKTLEHNLALLRSMDRLTKLGRPLMVGCSNKSLWGELLGLPVQERGNATQAATAVLAERGVLIHRVHDVELTAQTLRIVQALN